MPAIINKDPRKLAPVVEVNAPIKLCQREQVVENTRKKLGDKARGMHFFYGDANIAKTGQYECEGYVACGVDHKGDPLFMRPLKKHDEHLAEAASLSATAYKSAKNGEGDDYKTEVAGGGSIRPRPTKEE